MSSIFECERNGQRYVVEICLEGKFNLYPVKSLYQLLNETDAVRYPEGILEYIKKNISVHETVSDLADYEILPCLVPQDVRRGIVCGFGLTHETKLSNKPEPGDLPAFFIKGLADTLKPSGTALRMSHGAISACEEAEVVALFIISEEGNPEYLGYTFGNDLTDIEMAKSKRNYLSYAKLQPSAIAPQLYCEELPELVNGRTSIYREGKLHWEQKFQTGLSCLSYDVNELFNALWLHSSLRLPGTLIYLYMGADRNSADAGIHLAHGDTVVCDFEGGPQLTNLIEWEHAHA